MSVEHDSGGKNPIADQSFTRKILAEVERLNREKPLPPQEGLEEWLRNQFRIQELRSQSRMEQHEALGTQVHVLTGRGHGERLAQRHNRLLIAQDFLLATEVLANDSRALLTLAEHLVAAHDQLPGI